MAMLAAHVGAPADWQIGNEINALMNRAAKEAADHTAQCLLKEFEALITAQLANLRNDFDKKLAHVNHELSPMKILHEPLWSSTGRDGMAEDVNQLKCDVGELKDTLRQMQEMQENTTEDILNSNKKLNTKLAAEMQINLQDDAKSEASTTSAGSGKSTRTMRRTRKREANRAAGSDSLEPQTDLDSKTEQIIIKPPSAKTEVSYEGSAARSSQETAQTSPVETAWVWWLRECDSLLVNRMEASMCKSKDRGKGDNTGKGTGRGKRSKGACYNFRDFGYCGKGDKCRYRHMMYQDDDDEASDSEQRVQRILLEHARPDWTQEQRDNYLWTLAFQSPR